MTTNKPVNVDPAKAAIAVPTEVDWTVTVTEPLPNCPSVEAGWERIAIQTKWDEWRSESKMRGKGVVTTQVSPATEPLQVGDEYVVNVGRFMKIRRRVLESSTPATTAGGKMIFDSVGVALGGIVKARFRVYVGKERRWHGHGQGRGEDQVLALPRTVREDPRE